VTTAGTSGEAMNLPGGTMFDVALSEIVTPERGGIELLREIRKRDLEVPVLMVSNEPATRYWPRCPDP
jgi:DNA-binding NtrC family response regulator